MKRWPQSGSVGAFSNVRHVGGAKTRVSIVLRLSGRRFTFSDTTCAWSPDEKVSAVLYDANDVYTSL